MPVPSHYTWSLAGLVLVACGAAPREPCDTGPSPLGLGGSVDSVYDLAVDDSYVYVGTLDGVSRVPRTGGAWAHVAGSEEADSIAIDATNVYWSGVYTPPSVDGGRSSTSTGLFSAPLGGGPMRILNLGYWDSSGLDVDNTEVYGISGSSLAAEPLDGGVSRSLPLDGNRNLQLQGFALYGGDLYVTTLAFTSGVPQPGQSSIYRVPTSGGAPVALITGQNDPTSIAVDASGVYWVAGEVNASPRAVMRANLDGSSVVTLASVGALINDLALGAGDVFWSEATPGRIVKMPKAGGAAVILADNLSLPTKVVLHGGNVYWIAQPYLGGGVSDGGAGGVMPGGPSALMTACQ